MNSYANELDNEKLGGGQLAMSFEKMGISHIDVRRSLDRIRSGELGRWDTPSRNTYIQCPIGKDLWDIKPVIGLIWEDADPTIRPNEWVTNTYEPALLRLGFTIVKFSLEGRRRLGIYGCDLAELNNPHKVFYPGGQEAENSFKPEQEICEFPDGKKREVLTSPYVRNSLFKRQTIDAANGLCDACKQVSFLTINGVGFLEVHHKKWLSEGGPDHPENMVALCPNCHRQEHFGTNRLYFFP